MNNNYNKEEPIGWKKLVAGFPGNKERESFRLPAYSEFMPPPRLGKSYYGEVTPELFSDDDLYGWKISEMEEEYELKPGINYIGKQIMEHITRFGKGLPEYHIAGHGRKNLINNPYWSAELAESAGKLEHEHFVVFLPMMLSRTQDDKGRMRWTFFGNSVIDEPEYAFWKSFYSNPNTEKDEKEFQQFITDILTSAYGEKLENIHHLHEKGFRILQSENDDIIPQWGKSYFINDNAPFENVRYLLTFRPFSRLPDEVKSKYVSGQLNLLPYPGSLVFWGMQSYLRLKKELPDAMQIPLLRLVTRHSGHEAVRVPQSGWIYEPHADVNEADISKELILDTYHRTHRWQRIAKNEDELSHTPRLAKMERTLFSTDLSDMALYDKPMARNCHLWKKDYELLLDGPNATHEEIMYAEAQVMKGGLFGYRFFFPPMNVGSYEIYWERPLVAYVSDNTKQIEILPQALLGYISATKNDDTVELFPRLQSRETYLSALLNFTTIHDAYSHQTSLNILNLFDQQKTFAENHIPRSFAQHLLRVNKQENLEQWLEVLPKRACDKQTGQSIQKELESLLEKDNPTELPHSLTFDYTASRSFEEDWWNDIFTLSHGMFVNKDNADCVKDEIALNSVKHNERDLKQLGDYLILRHRETIDNAGMKGSALCGELQFKWETDFDFEKYEGWKNNQDGHEFERDILVVIPGKHRGEAVVMADHYDTAYMEDVYDKTCGGSGARLSAAGADDNHSATSALLQANSIFLKLAKAGLLQHDVWLLHLTGEEFPSDCLGARHFCEAVTKKSLVLKNENNELYDLSNTKVIGMFVSDMIGHNRDNDKDIFQISPGKSVQSSRLAYQAHIANMIWNSETHKWNSGKERSCCKRGKRSADGLQIPPLAKHLPLNGEVRTHLNPESSLYNTDGQIFSDVGIPVVLFMENYDIHRTGYHDTKDTMENIDLDYGAALAAIVIETVARVANG